MIKVYKGAAFSWWNAVKPDHSDRDLILKQFRFHPLTMSDIMASAKHQKFDARLEYSFLVLLFPSYDKKKQAVLGHEVDFAIGSDFLLMVHDNQLIPLVHAFQKKEHALLESPIMLLHRLLEGLFLYIYPIIDHVTVDINGIEKNIAHGRHREMVGEILGIKRKIVNLRRIMYAHKNILKKLLEKDVHSKELPETKAYFENLVDRAKDIWQILESQNEHVDALRSTNESMISFRLNDIMKTLTIFSVVVFPLTLFAAIFGMNVGNMPFIDLEYGFWIIICLMAFCTTGMLMFFKKKGWL